MQLFKDILKQTTILITCPKGLSDYLQSEIESSGYRPERRFPTGVSITGSLTDCMLLNLVLSTAHHVLLLIKEFPCKHPDELYRSVFAVDWENVVPVDGYVCVTSTVHTPSITDARFANLRCKDAIVDRLAQKNGKRCDSGSSRDRTVVHIYWNGPRCSLFIDTSGEPLSKRGYRLIAGNAPLQETLAAAIVRATGWRGSGCGHFINPMCGSGTLAIEAAMAARHKAPGATRKNFGFMHLIPYNPDDYEGLVRTAASTAKETIPGKIIATDRDPNVLSAAQSNAKTAGVENDIDFKLCDFDETNIPDSPKSGVIVLNPEYGFRMGNPEQLKNVYKGIGDFFKRQCGGYTGFVLTGNFELAKHIGLKAKRKRPFLNGKIECRLYEYELYEGSRL